MNLQVESAQLEVGRALERERKQRDADGHAPSASTVASVAPPPAPAAASEPAVGAVGGERLAELEEALNVRETDAFSLSFVGCLWGRGA